MSHKPIQNNPQVMDKPMFVGLELSDLYGLAAKSEPSTSTSVTFDSSQQESQMDSAENDPFAITPFSFQAFDENMAGDIEFEEISLEDLLEIERQNPTSIEDFSFTEPTIHEPIPQSPHPPSGPFQAPSAVCPPSPRPRSRRHSACARGSTELSSYEKGIRSYRGRMAKRKEKADMAVSGFRLKEAIITEAEMCLYRDSSLGKWRVKYPSPLRRCWGVEL